MTPLETLAKAAAEEFIDIQQLSSGHGVWIREVIIHHFQPLADELEATKAKLRRAISLLQKCEWAGDTGDDRSHCPVCLCVHPNHDDESGCELHEFLEANKEILP